MLDTIGLQRYARDRIRENLSRAWRVAAIRRARCQGACRTGSGHDLVPDKYVVGSGSLPWR
jgi:hypothetical protein